MAPPEFADQCARPGCPIRGTHGAHCPRIQTARLAACLECRTVILLAHDYPAPTTRCGDCRRRTAAAMAACDRTPTRDWLRRFRPTADDAPLTAMPTEPMAPDRTAASRLKAAEKTMRLRTMAAGRTWTGRRDAPKRPAYDADDQDDVEPSQLRVMRYGGQLPVLHGLSPAEVA